MQWLCVNSDNSRTDGYCIIAIDRKSSPELLVMQDAAVPYIQYNMKKTDFDIYLIETFQDYLNFKQLRRRKEDEIKSFKVADKTIIEQQEYPSIVNEDETIGYNSERNSILYDSILSYVENMNASEIEDAKTIQLMLLKLAHGKCDAKTYERIINVDRVVAKKASNNFNFETGSNNNIYAGGGI